MVFKEDEGVISISKDCVDIISTSADPTRNFFRVRFRNPKLFVGGKYSTPQWGQKAAMTIGTKYYGVKGCKITMAQPVGGRWMIQNVLIPKNGGVEMTEELALQIANHIQDRIEREGQFTAVMCRDNETKRYISKIKGQHIERDERGRFAPHAAEEFGAEDDVMCGSCGDYEAVVNCDNLSCQMQLCSSCRRQHKKGNDWITIIDEENDVAFEGCDGCHREVGYVWDNTPIGKTEAGIPMQRGGWIRGAESFGAEEFGAEIASGLHKCDACGKRTETYYDEVWSDMYCREACARGKPDKCRGSCGENGWEVEFNSVNHRGFSNRPSIDSVYGVSIYCKDCGVGFYGDMRNEIYEQEPDRGESKELRAEETIFREIVRIKSADWNDWKRFNEEHYPYSKRKIAELWNQYKISGECVGEDCICKRSGEEFEAQRGMKS